MITPRHWGAALLGLLALGLGAAWWASSSPSTDPGAESEVQEGETPSSHRASRTVVRHPAPLESDRLDGVFAAVTDALGARWIRCPVGLELPARVRVDGVTRQTFDQEVFRAMVPTSSGGGVVTPVFEPVDCAPTTPKESIDCMVENQERQKDSTFPVAVLAWSGAEPGEVGRCTLSPPKRIPLKGRIDGGRMGALWGCGQRILVTDGTFEIEGYADTHCDFVFDDGAIRGEVRLATGDGSMELVVPASTGDGERYSKLEQQVLEVEAAELAMKTPSPLVEVVGGLSGEEREIVESWLASDQAALEERLETAREHLDRSLQIEEYLEEFQALRREWSQPEP